MIESHIVINSKVRIIFVFAFLATSFSALAQIETRPTSNREILEIVVVGRQPGPPMWKVNKGDHELWIFGILTPLPKNMVWESDKVKSVIDRSQEYIYIKKPEQKIPLNPFTLYKALRLASQLANNADGRSLEEVLPDDLYMRFSVLEEQYPIRKVDNMRPYFAADAIHSNAVRSNGMTNDPGVEEKIARLVRRNRAIKKTAIQFGPEVLDYALLKEEGDRLMNGLSNTVEIDCLKVSLESIETDLDGLKSRANAWALGYVDELRYYQDYPDQKGICMQVWTGVDDINDLIRQSNTQWLTAAELALSNNETTFAVLEIEQLIRPDGVLEELHRKGYEIREP